MVFFKIILNTIFLSVLLLSYKIEIKKQWHLLGAIEDFNISQSTTGNCKLYRYKIGEWDIYESNKVKGLTQIKKTDGFYAYSPSVCILSYGNLDFTCKEAGINKNYEIKATYCSYSGPDEGHFWKRGEGFFDSPKENYYHNKFSREYVHCSISPKNTIEKWGGKSACFEAHTYWGHI